MSQGRSFLPYGRQTIEDDDVDAVVNVLRGDWLTTGPSVSAFEEALARQTGARHAVVFNSGTAALHLAALALDLGPGHVVVVPSVTFVATANAIRYVGAEVVFADVDADTGLMQPDHLRAALAAAGPKAKAVFPVHLAGQTVDMAAVAAIAQAAGLAVVEDACHALGSSDDTARIGACSHSAMACFSFHPVKAIAMGEGGAITTNDTALADRLMRLRSHGLVRQPELFRHRDDALTAEGQANPWYYELHELGFNYRASDIQCALGISQLAKLERFLDRRRALVARYDGLLPDLAPHIKPIPRVAGPVPGWHLYPVLVDFDAIGKSRAQVMAELHGHGIGSQVHYYPVHRQPYYRERYGDIQLPGADAYYRRTLSLPLFPAMPDSDVDRVVEALAQVLA